MKVLYLDLETTGLDSNLDQVIELAAVVEDFVSPIHQLPKFHTYVRHDRVNYLEMHLKYYIDVLGRYNELQKLGRLSEFKYRYEYIGIVNSQFHDFLYDNFGLTPDGPTKITVGGKNVAAFDYQFLAKWPNWKLEGSNLLFSGFKLGTRVVDPCMMYFNPLKDTVPPDTNECCKRAGVDYETDHTALNDALAILKCVRKFYNIPFQV